VNVPDFEINACLRAKRLTSRIPPDVRAETEGDDVSLASDQRRSGLPTVMESGGRYSDVLVEKRLVAEKHPSGERDADERARLGRDG
jgi:hypothetical protein